MAVVGYLPIDSETQLREAPSVLTFRKQPSRENPSDGGENAHVIGSASVADVLVINAEGSISDERMDLQMDNGDRIEDVKHGNESEICGQEDSNGMDVEDDVVFLLARTRSRVFVGEVAIDDDDDGDDNFAGNVDVDGNNNDKGGNFGNGDDNNNYNDNKNTKTSTPVDDVLIVEWIIEEYRTVFFEFATGSDFSVDVEDDDIWVAFSEFGTIEKLRLESDVEGMVVFDSLQVS